MRISVFVTSYNQRGYLVKAIDSVLAQTLTPVEVIVVDDASTDGSQEVIRSYQHRFPGVIRPILHASNLGVTRSRIDALEAVRGDYVTYVDGDDRLLPRKLELEATALRRSPYAAIAFSNNRYVSPSGVTLWTWIEGNARPPEGEIFKETAARAFPRRSLFRMELVDYAAWKTVGFHNPALRLYEDYEMRIRLTKRFEAVYVDEVTAEITHHRQGLSSRPAREHLEALCKVWAFSRSLLTDLSPAERASLERDFRGWLRQIAVGGIKHALRQCPPSLPGLADGAHFLLREAFGRRLPD